MQTDKSPRKINVKCNGKPIIVTYIYEYSKLMIWTVLQVNYTWFFVFVVEETGSQVQNTSRGNSEEIE